MSEITDAPLEPYHSADKGLSGDFTHKPPLEITAARDACPMVRNPSQCRISKMEFMTANSNLGPIDRGEFSPKVTWVISPRPLWEFAQLGAAEALLKNASPPVGLYNSREFSSLQPSLKNYAFPCFRPTSCISTRRRLV
jgi:hypothetical protein